jgi:hypothetical protein
MIVDGRPNRFGFLSRLNATRQHYKEIVMPRRVFFSFHFANDHWRTQQVRNINALEGQTVCAPNAWEDVKRKGSDSIERWIDENMKGKSCVVVLVGAETAERPWVRREIVKGWDSGRGVLGIRINALLDVGGQSSRAGTNPFDKINWDNSGKQLSAVAPIFTPAGNHSREVYASIRDNIENWIEHAIAIRNAN